MTYEEKYNQAIDVIKKIKEANKNNAELVNFIEYNYPELKESEDDKIRKEIILFVKSHDGQTIPLNQYESWITWLEKQGEQKKNAMEAWKEMRLEVYAQASGNRHEPNCSDDNSKIFSLNDIDEIFEKVAEKQGEQKSIDNLKWNELTWKDINNLETVMNQVNSEFCNGISQKAFGEEVLERFRNTKEDEYVDTCEQKLADKDAEKKELKKIDNEEEDELTEFEKELENFIYDWTKQ